MVDELDAAFGIQQQHAFNHAVEEGLQAGLGAGLGGEFLAGGGLGGLAGGGGHLGGVTAPEPVVLEPKEGGAGG